MNLAIAIKELEQEAITVEQKHKKSIEHLYETIEFLRERNTQCEKCCGDGEILDETFTNYVPCDACDGTGKVKTKYVANR